MKESILILKNFAPYFPNSVLNTCDLKISDGLIQANNCLSRILRKILLKIPYLRNLVFTKDLKRVEKFNKIIIFDDQKKEVLKYIKKKSVEMLYFGIGIQ